MMEGGGWAALVPRNAHALAEPLQHLARGTYGTPLC